MGRALLVANENMLDVVLLEQLIVDWKDRPARIAEHDFDALIHQSFDYHFCAGHRTVCCIRHHRRPWFASHLPARHKKRPRLGPEQRIVPEKTKPLAPRCAR